MSVLCRFVFTRHMKCKNVFPKIHSSKIYYPPWRALDDARARARVRVRMRTTTPFRGYLVWVESIGWLGFSVIRLRGFFGLSFFHENLFSLHNNLIIFIFYNFKFSYLDLLYDSIALYLSLYNCLHQRKFFSDPLISKFY